MMRNKELTEITDSQRKRTDALEKRIWILEHPQKFEILQEVQWDILTDRMVSEGASNVRPLITATIIGTEIIPPDHYNTYRRYYIVVLSEDVEGWKAGEQLSASEPALRPTHPDTIP